MVFAITKMSSKGQVVIPKEMRKNIHEGEKFVIYEVEGKIIMERVDKIDKKLKEDLEFARRTEEAWKSYDRGEFITQSVEEFRKELSKC